MDAQMLMSLLASRQGGASPAGLDGTDPSAIDAYLAQAAQGNPQVAAILQMMEARKAAAAREPVVVDAAAEDVTSRNLLELTAQLEAAQAEIMLLRDRCDTVAAALGACGLCWGQDLSCRACRGKGAPGRSIPDPQLFIEFVLPAVRLAHASRPRSRNVAPLTPAASGASRGDATPPSHQPEGSSTWN